MLTYKIIYLILFKPLGNITLLTTVLVIQEFLTTTIAHIFSTIAFIFFFTEPPNIFDATILIVNLFFAPFSIISTLVRSYSKSKK